MQQTISVTRALAELKNINERINNAIQSGVFLGLTKGKGSNKVMLGVGEVSSSTATIQGSYDKVDSLIAQRQKIKAALVKSNAETTVSFQGREISVAEAIELKSTVSFKELYLGRLRNAKTVALQQVDSYNSKLWLKFWPHWFYPCLGGQKTNKHGQYRLFLKRCLKR